MAEQETTTAAGPPPPPPQSSDDSSTLSGPLNISVKLSDNLFTKHLKAVLGRVYPDMRFIVSPPDLGCPVGPFGTVDPYATDDELRASLPEWNQIARVIGPPEGSRARSGPFSVNCTLFTDPDMAHLTMGATTIIFPPHTLDFAAAKIARTISITVRAVEFACQHPGYCMLAVHGWEEGCRRALAQNLIEVEGDKVHIYVVTPQTPDAPVRRISGPHVDFLYE